MCPDATHPASFRRVTCVFQLCRSPHATPAAAEALSVVVSNLAPNLAPMAEGGGELESGGASRMVGICVLVLLFPTCQLRVARFYVGPQPQVQDGSVPRRTSTPSDAWQRSPPDLNRELRLASVPRKCQIAVGTARPQQPAPDRSGHRRTSQIECQNIISQYVRSECMPDRIECQSVRQIECQSTCQRRMPDYMPDRVPAMMPDSAQSICQTFTPDRVPGQSEPEYMSEHIAGLKLVHMSQH